jgi:hypothetical protein
MRTAYWYCPLLLCLLLLLAGCDKKTDDETGDSKKPNTEQPGNGDDNNGSTNPTLSINQSAISATYTAGTYAVAVTSNTTWTAAVNTDATAWCSLSPASAAGNGTVTVNVTENAATITRAATVTIVAGSLTRTISLSQAANPGPPPALTVNPPSINAPFTAGSYSVVVTSNTTWTAAVNTDATAWCSLSPASAAGNGTVTVNVTENAATITRAATVTIAAGSLTRTISLSQAANPGPPPPPPYAASTHTWTFDNQTWSDAIQIPECNKNDFEAHWTEPRCRSYTSGTNTWYYYNWPYVDANKSTMCPSPWRVPGQGDFAALTNNTTYDVLINAWGLGGYANGTSMSDVSTEATYWSTLSYGGDDSRAHIMAYHSSNLYMTNTYKNFGLQVRCVQ